MHREELLTRLYTSMSDNLELSSVNSELKANLEETMALNENLKLEAE